MLDRLQGAGVTAVATSPYVMEPADEASGSREPPSDAGAGSVRLLDRPLWGRRELWVRTAPSFIPRSELYEGLAYQPPPASELTHSQGPLVGQFFRRAKDRGMRVYFQVQAARQAARHGVWVNRYGSLSDRKLEILCEVFKNAE